MQNPEVDVLSFPVPPLGCNCSILICKSSGEAIVADPGGSAERIIQILEERGARVRWIIHTHAHFDHCLGTHAVAEHCRAQAKPHGSENGAPEGAQTAERTDATPKQEAPPLRVGMHRDDLFLYEKLGVQCRMFGLPEQAAETPVDHFLEDEEPLEFGRARLQVLHTPGHTPGSTCFHLENSGLLLSGDTLFQFGIGRTDLPGGDGEAILKSIKTRLLTLDEGTRVIPGHGPMTRIFEEKRANPFL